MHGNAMSSWFSDYIYSVWSSAGAFVFKEHCSENEDEQYTTLKNILEWVFHAIQKCLKFISSSKIMGIDVLIYCNIVNPPGKDHIKSFNNVNSLIDSPPLYSTLIIVLSATLQKILQYSQNGSCVLVSCRKEGLSCA